MTRRSLVPFSLLAALSLATPAPAQQNSVNITVTGNQRCISSNSTPHHSIGTFPNRGNPHRFRAQNIDVCVDANPSLTGRISQARVSGISVTGILLRPGTADYYDPTSRRGFSRNPYSGWRLEGMGNAQALGLDVHHAHVDRDGTYHYHAVPLSLASVQTGTLIGWAADGFEIHYAGASVQSSWQLRSGTRATAPYGAFDGTYEEDWHYVAGSGDLDQCNAGYLNGELVYFATDTFPFFPRCFHGTVSSDFVGRR